MPNNQPAKTVFWRSWLFKIVLVILGYLTIVGSVEQIDKQIKGEWKTFTTENSPLLNDNIRVLTVDNQGQVWVGTYQGLYSVSPDGIWVNYANKNSNLLGNEITALAIDGLGNVWVGTDNGLLVLDSKGHEIYVEQDDAYSKSRIKALALDNYANVWVGTTNGLYVFKNKRVISVYTEANSGLVDDSVWALAVDRFNRVWVGTWSGVSVLDEYGNWIVYQRDRKQQIENGLTSNDIEVFLIDGHDRVWIGTECCGISILDADGNWISDTISPISTMNHSRIRALALDKDDQVWVGIMEAGLVLVRPEGSLRIYTPDNSDLPYYSVWALSIDNKDQLWVGTLNGLSVIDLKEELPRTATSDWVVFRKMVRLPISTMMNIGYFLSEIIPILRNFWICFSPFLILIVASMAGMYKGGKQENLKLFGFSLLALILSIFLIIVLGYFLIVLIGATQA